MLMLHAGAEPVEYEKLRELPVPAATDTHVPIAHSAVVDMVKYSLGFYGHEVVQEDYGVTPDGARFFGVLSLKSDYGSYCDQVGLRNSHDKRFPIGISFGSRCFVCDNLAFSGDHVIRRKHTLNAKRELPGLVAEIVEPLRDQRQRQANQFLAFQERIITQAEFDHLLLSLYRKGVLNLTRVPEVIEAYENPAGEWGDEFTAWRAFNAVTWALRGKVAENPATTTQLHQLVDGLCHVVH